MSARPMTVLQVVPALQTGGVERTTVDMAAALTADGDRALVASEGGRMESELAAAGGELTHMPVASKNLLTMRRNAVRLADFVEREGVDIIHARSRAPAWSALWAASWTCRPLVTTFHGAYNSGNSAKNAYNSVMARGDVVIANSAYTAALIAERHRFARERIVIIHRGIDLAAFRTDATARAADLRAKWGIAPDERVILHLARLTPWKGQEVLLDALCELALADGPRWVCVMAGDDQGRTEFREKLVEKAQHLGLSPRLRIVGHVADVPAALAAADVAVQPSVEPEAFGRAAVEAQAAGVAVVAADHGAVRETVLCPPEVAASRRTGWRVPPGEATPLAEALAEALSLSPETLNDIGERGRAHAETHFSLTAMKAKTLAVYHSVLDER